MTENLRRLDVQNPRDASMLRIRKPLCKRGMEFSLSLNRSYLFMNRRSWVSLNSERWYSYLREPVLVPMFTFGDSSLGLEWRFWVHEIFMIVKWFQG